MIPDSIAAAQQAFRSRQLEPGALVAATFARIRAHNPSLNAYLEIFDSPDRAEEFDRPLDGIPIAVKDLFDVAGHVTTAGSRFFRDHVATEDAPVVRRLREAGAVLTGKTNLHEWALGVTNNNPHFGACRNPWDLDRIPGGSSGGSAAAVAARLCLGALGSDTGGSIRIPAALCGIVGLKPTRGRVSLRGVVPLSWSHDHAGPMARTVRDVALMLNVIAGYDPRDPVSMDTPVPDFGAALEGARDLKGVRVGVPAAYFFEYVDDAVAERVQAAIGVLRDLGASMVEVDLREASEMAEHTRAILLADAAAYHRERLESQPELFGADTWTRLRAGLEFTAVDYARARQAQREWKRRLREVFEGVEALVTPTTPVAAPRVDEAEGVSSAGQLTRFTSLFNFAGAPAISAPCGFVEGRLPVGMQIVGRWWDEITVLRIAHAYEQAAGWHTHKPETPGSPTASPRSADI